MPEVMTSYAEVAERLRALRVAAGSPSYAEIAKRVGSVRAGRGGAAPSHPPARVTVYDCFRTDRRRFDVELVADIGRALGLGDDEAREWEHTCWALQHRVDAAYIATARSSAPEPLARFAGRVAELERLVGLAASSVVVVSGMAGVGKTELASEAARRLLARGAVGRVVFAELRGFDPDQPPANPAALMDAIARAAQGDAELPGERTRRRQAYAHVLAARPTVLILDDAASAGQVKPLLPRVAGVTVVITSRHSIGVELGVDEISLDVLSTDDAVAFLDDVVGGLDGPEERGAAATLAGAVGNLPLALGVVASRIAERAGWTLADHTAALVGDGGLRRLDDAVAAVLDRSHAAMDPQTRRALRLLASQPLGDLGADSVAALIGSDASTADGTIRELVGASMARQPRPGRIGLHALVRAHGRERSLDEDRPSERDDALAGLLDHLVATCRAAKQVIRPDIPVDRRSPTSSVVPTLDQDTAERWLADEFDTLRSATSDVCRAARPTIAVDLCEALTWYVDRRGFHRDFAVLLEHAVASARVLGDRTGEGLAELHRGQTLIRTGQAERAAAGLRRAEQLLAGTSYASSVKNTLAVLAYKLGDLRAAATAVLELAEEAEQANRPGPAGRMHDNAAVALARLGDLDGALRHHGKARRFAETAGDHECVASSLANASGVHLLRHDAAAAMDAATQALTLCEQYGFGHTEGFARTNLAAALTELGRPDEAIPVAMQALERARAQGDLNFEASVLNNLGDTYAAAGRPVEAHDALVAARSIAAKIGDTFEEGRSLARSGRLAFARGDRDEAGELWASALALIDPDDPESADIRADLARLETVAPSTSSRP